MKLDLMIYIFVYKLWTWYTYFITINWVVKVSLPVITSTWFKFLFSLGILNHPPDLIGSFALQDINKVIITYNVVSLAN